MVHHNLACANTSPDHHIGELQQVQDVPLVRVTGHVPRPSARHPHPVDVVLAAAAAGHPSHVTTH